MRRWKRALRAHGRTTGLVAIVVVWLCVFQVWWVAPRRAEQAARQDALAGMRTELTQIRTDVDRLPAVEAAIAVLDARIAHAQAARADARDTTAVLRRIELLAGAARLSIRGYTPEPALAHELHAEWPSRLELGGGFDDVRAFFDRVEGCLGAVAIGDLTLRAADAAYDGATVSATFTLTAFAFNGAPANRADPLPDDDCRTVSAVADAAQDAPEAHPDPFSPRLPAVDPLAGGSTAPGLAGLRVGELTLQGLVLSAGRPLAVVAAPGGETYILRGGEQLLDGSVAAVHADEVVLLERRGGSAVASEIRKALIDRTDGR
ncbi:MAG: type 4a pilus biogenesis protein PilO [Acidobacteria bacterium]|nr:type 4a pilus biogenesis protein PilO [Acidobacteriota bacterium]